MGLNESYSHVRGQILLIDPLPSINKVFSLIIQEERQRMISSSSISFKQNTTALFTKTMSPTRFAGNKSLHIRKNQPICSHYGIFGHTVEKCYRIYGFPPGYKFNRGKNASPSVNQVSGLNTHQLPITSKQCQQLINMFKPTISEHDSSINQVSSFTNKESEIPMQGESITSSGDSLITAQLSTLDLKHFVFASSLFLTQQSSLSNPAKTP
jgi:hypothetical protein